MAREGLAHAPNLPDRHLVIGRKKSRASCGVEGYAPPPIEPLLLLKLVDGLEARRADALPAAEPQLRFVRAEHYRAV